MVLGECHVTDDLGGTCGFLTGVTENENLMLSCSFDDLLVADLVHEHHSLDCFFLRDSDVDLFKRYGSVALVEVMQTSVGVHP